MKRFDRYIRKCFKDAAENEGRTLTSKDYSFRYYIFNNKIIAIFLDCEYARVERQVRGRIERNFEKNFGLEVTSRALEHDANRYNFNPNYCVCKVKTTTRNGKEEYLWVSFIREEDVQRCLDRNQKVPYCLMFELAKKKGIINPKSDDDHDEFYRKVSWEELKKLWMEVYNETKFKNLDIETSDNVTVLG